MTGKEVQTGVEVITTTVSPVLDSALGRFFSLRGTFSGGFKKIKIVSADNAYIVSYKNLKITA